MIRGEELCLGDLVLIEGKARRVESITKKKVGYHITPTDSLHYARLCEVSVIPLTKDILKANGFVEDLCYWDYHVDEHVKLQYYFHEHRLERQWYGRDEWQNHKWFREISVRLKCYYLHELQHACRMCGINIKWKV